MAGIGSSVLTLTDWAKRLDPDGKIPVIAELLGQSNPILQDAAWVEGNLPVGHRVTIRTGLPTVYWRLLNQGVPPSKSTTAQADEQCGMLEAWSEVDQDLAELNGNLASLRLSEARAYIEAMNQEMAQTIFYGNSAAAPEEFNGLSVRYSDIGVGSPANSQNILDAGGTGSDNASIWLVVWSDQTVFGIFPKGSRAGLEHNDLGLQVVETTAGIAGNRMMAYRDRWKWRCGVCVKDWRYAVRICNIDISNLVAKSSAADLVEYMIRAIHRIPDMNMGNAVFYMNRTCFEMLDIQRLDAVGAAGMTYQDVDGMVRPTFRNIPIKVCDVLTEAEARVV